MGRPVRRLERRFTVANVPVMTRLLLDERQVLDTLIDAGIARSRSEALAWCVKLVGANQAEWIDQLRDAVAGVGTVRAEGPDRLTLDLESRVPGVRSRRSPATR